MEMTANGCMHPFSPSLTGTSGVETRTTFNKLTQSLWKTPSSGNLSPGYLPVQQAIKALAAYSSDAASLFTTIKAEPVVIGPNDQLISIKKKYGFSVSQLAHILEVSRPSIYSWLKGNDVNEDNIQKINTFSSAISNIQEDFKSQLSRLCNYQLASGKSVSETLTDIAKGEADANNLFNELLPTMESWAKRKLKAEKLDNSPQQLLSKTDLSPTIKTVG